VSRILARNALASDDHEPTFHQIYVTGSPERFTEVARTLFGRELPPIKPVPLDLVEGRAPERVS
jgi:hypothetical protein